MKTLVWRPGSVTVPTTIQRGVPISAEPRAGSEQVSVPDTLVVATPGEVYEQLLAYAGNVEVIVDTSGGAATIPSGMVWDFKGLGGFVGLEPGTVVTIATSAQVKGLASLRNVQFVGVPTALVPSVIPAPVLRLAHSFLNANAAFPMVQTADGVPLELEIVGDATITGNGGAPCIKLGTTVGGAASNLAMYSTFPVTFGANCIAQSHVATATVRYVFDGFVAPGALVAACPNLGTITEVTG